jgi:hypothetical protein
MIKPPSKQEWVFAEFPPERSSYLELDPSFEDIAQRVAGEAVCEFAEPDRLCKTAAWAPEGTWRAYSTTVGMGLGAAIGRTLPQVLWRHITCCRTKWRLPLEFGLPSKNTSSPRGRLSPPKIPRVARANIGPVAGKCHIQFTIAKPIWRTSEKDLAWAQMLSTCLRARLRVRELARVIPRLLSQRSRTPMRHRRFA